MTAPLEKEVMEAIEQAGIRVRSFRRLSKLDSARNGRIVYRIDHDRGTVKARRVEDEATACQLEMLRKNLPEEFAPILLKHGRVLIEEWMDGEVLPDIPEPQHLTTAGALLARLHSIHALAHAGRQEMRSTADQLFEARRCMSIVVAAGALDEKHAIRLDKILQRLDPGLDTYGLVHLDYCGENMVFDRAGKLRVIDNERFRHDLIGYDLGRTWFRWNLSAQDWDSFCTAYAIQLPFPNQLNALHFWKIVASIRSAELRLRAYPEKLGDPVNWLRSFAEAEA